MRSSLMARTSSFAHLAGLGRRRARADDAPPADDKDKDGKGSRAEGGEDEDKDKDQARAADDPPAQYPDDDKDASRAEGDDKDKDKDKDKDARRARAEDGDDESCEDDDDQEEMSGKSATAKARLREQARCAAIFAHPVAAENVQLACSLAFETRLPRKAAIAVLKSQADRPATRAEIGSGRAARNPDLGAGGGGSPTGKQGVKASWDAALGKVGIKPKG